MKTKDKQIKPASMLLILFSLLSSNITAQTISGTIIDEQNQPIEFANIALFSLPDSVLITGAVANEKGEFSLNQNENTNNMFLQISFLGYKTQTVPATQNQTIVLIPTLNELGEVVVSAHHRVFRLERGDIIASVRGTILETLTNAGEVIAQLPFLSEREGSFIVFGRGNPVIYINNRLVRDNQELQQLSPLDIRNIRVITSPGAAYDATVRAVIKITTIRPIGEGLSGLFSVRGVQGHRFSGNEQISLNYRTGAWDVFGTLFHNYHNYRTRFGATQEMFLPDNKYRQIYNNYERGSTQALNTTVGLNFNPSNNHSTGIRYTRRNATFWCYAENKIDFLAGDVSEDILQAGVIRSPDNTHQINSYYDGKLSERLSLNINTDIALGRDKNENENYFPNVPGERIITIGTQEYTLYGGRGILSNQFQNGILNIGTEYAYTNVMQTYKTENQELGLRNTNDEAIQSRIALFASYQAQFSSFGLNAGIRYENIIMDYFENETKNDEQSKVYHKFFPNISLSYANEVFQTMAGFERKIHYPSYRQLRSNIQYSSPFIYESGNPLLLPSIENQFSIMFTWKSVQAMAGYSINENEMVQLPLQFEDRPIILLRNENLKRSQAANIGVSYAPAFGIWQPQFEAGIMKQWLRLSDVETSYNQPIFSSKWFNTFLFSKGYILRIDASTLSSGNSGVAYVYPSWGIDLRLSKRFISNRLIVQLAASDIFKTNTNHWNIDYGNINMLYNKNLDSRQVSLTATYRFNATQNRFKGQQSTDEINRL
jgi:hypothetical protein